MNRTSTKNPASEEALAGARHGYPSAHRYACICIVALAANEHNPNLLQEVLADPAILLSIPQGSMSSLDRLDQMVRVGALDADTATELRAWSSLAEAEPIPDPSVDTLFYIARYVAAHTVAKEVRQGVPGLWAHFVAVVEAQPPYARNSGEGGND